ncbi:MAG: glyoxalase [Proteobacteria bacterium]|nr:glyoxalase [Pseudomonadota bacterium]
MKIQFNRLNHIQICIPHGEEDKGREFYCGILGLNEIEKPERMKANGGFWVEIADVQIHIGTEDMTGQSKRHPAFEVEDLDSIKSYLMESGIQLVEQQSVNGFKRFSFFDYWNNRIELMQCVK